jgi:hypothetical protein
MRTRHRSESGAGIRVMSVHIQVLGKASRSIALNQRRRWLTGSKGHVLCVLGEAKDPVLGVWWISSTAPRQQQGE